MEFTNSKYNIVKKKYSKNTVVPIDNFFEIQPIVNNIIDDAILIANVKKQMTTVLSQLKLRIKTIQHNNEIENECPICFEQLDKYNLINYKCKHKFHMTCIGDWELISQDIICPLCKCTEFEIMDDDYYLSTNNLYADLSDSLDSADSLDYANNHPVNNQSLYSLTRICEPCIIT